MRSFLLVHFSHNGTANVNVNSCADSVHGIPRRDLYEHKVNAMSKKGIKDPFLDTSVLNQIINHSDSTTHTWLLSLKIDKRYNFSNSTTVDLSNEGTYVVIFHVLMYLSFYISVRPFI